MNGYGDDLFGPDDFMNREQLVAIVHRYARYKGADGWHYPYIIFTAKVLPFCTKFRKTIPSRTQRIVNFSHSKSGKKKGKKSRNAKFLLFLLGPSGET